MEPFAFKNLTLTFLGIALSLQVIEILNLHKNTQIANLVKKSVKQVKKEAKNANKKLKQAKQTIVQAKQEIVQAKQEVVQVKQDAEQAIQDVEQEQEATDEFCQLGYKYNTEGVCVAE
jgi:Holliday junction resolvasome RuvABC DNA-binding subunit